MTSTTIMKKEDIVMKLWKLKDLSTFHNFANRSQRSHNELSSTGSDIEDELISEELTTTANSECSDDVLETQDTVKFNDVLEEKVSKPSQSYIALIATAILTSVEKRLVLSDIYQYIMEKYSYFQKQDKSWRNSIRHNLSLNECFIKAGRSEQGKGHYWAIHPANFDDFSQGDFRRRRARRRVRRSFYDNTPFNDVRHNVAHLSSQTPIAYWYQKRIQQQYLLNIHPCDKTHGSTEHNRSIYSKTKPPSVMTLNYSNSNMKDIMPSTQRKRKLSLFTIDSILDKEEHHHHHDKKVNCNKEFCSCDNQLPRRANYHPMYFRTCPTTASAVYKSKNF